MSLRENANALLSFFRPETVITVCKSREKRFQAPTLDFNDTSYTLRQNRERRFHQVARTRTMFIVVVSHFTRTSHRPRPLQQTSQTPHCGSDTFALLERPTWQTASCQRGHDLWSHIAMSHCQKLMLDIFTLPIQ